MLFHEVNFRAYSSTRYSRQRQYNIFWTVVQYIIIEIQSFLSKVSRFCVTHVTYSLKADET
jgi:hypothetical protein